MRSQWEKIVAFFKEDEVPYHASSLSFFTLFAITPTLLILLSVAENMPWFNDALANLKGFLFDLLVPTHRAIIEEYISGFFSNSDSMGFIGVGYILVTSLLFFRNYEYVVNRIFGTELRDVFNGLKIFFILLILSPVALAVSFILSAEVQRFVTWLGFGGFDPSAGLSFGIVWLLFFINYTISPNRYMPIRPVLIASLGASAVWYGGKQLFIYYILHNTTYTSLYGSLSVLIIFFLWIYISWMIFLYGLEAAKMLEGYEEPQDEDSENTSL